MYILIVGAGKVGYFLAQRLEKDHHSVSLVDKNKSVCEDVTSQLDALVINGDGCSPQILKEAGVERADVVAAVTGDDEDNLIICQLAKERFSVARTVGRVNDPKNEHIFFELGVDIPIDEKRNTLSSNDRIKLNSLILELKEKKNLSHSEVCDELNKKGVRTPTNKKWDKPKLSSYYNYIKKQYKLGKG